MTSNPESEAVDHDAPYNVTGHKFFIRSIFPDGEVIDDGDFAEHARWDWFSTVVDFTKSGDRVQLIDGATGEILEDYLNDKKPFKFPDWSKPLPAADSAEVAE